jgi:hypothetical protein
MPGGAGTQDGCDDCPVAGFSHGTILLQSHPQPFVSDHAGPVLRVVVEEFVGGAAD